MKTALIHYWLTNLRGGENVLAEFCRLFPDADIFTHAWNPAAAQEPFARHKITETFIAKLPGARKNSQKYLPLMPSALRRLDLDDYDFILSSESGPAKGVCKRPGALHVCYCHTPMRYLWDMYEEYYRSTGIAGKLAMTLFKTPLRRYDLQSAQGVDQFIANSRFVAERIRRIYHRDAEVVHPPADVEFFSQPAAKSEEAPYDLFVGQLIPYKRPDLALEACRRMKRRLIVVGDGPLRESLQREYAADDILFTGRAPREKLRELYAGARALLFPGVEDFGIVPVEAQAAGTPVIALGCGGALETVEDGKTGLFFKEQTADSLCAAIEEFESRRFVRAAITEHAKAFSPEKFRSKLIPVLIRAGWRPTPAQSADFKI